jgi:hypothetical protein
MTSSEIAANISPEQAKALAARLFNRVWDLIENSDRTEAEELEMIHSAHASRLHWQQIGGPKEWAIGEWQCARVYCEVGFPESAIFHAQACLEIVESNDVPLWMHASTFEILARSYWAAEDINLAKLARGRALQLLPQIEDAAERERIAAQVAELTF